jgi:hypothetical protein
MRAFAWLGLLTIVFVSMALGAGGVGTRFGTERGMWTEDHTVVFIARIEAVVNREGINGMTHEVTLVPLATLAGDYDPTTRPEKLVAGAWVGPMGTRIQSLPQPGVTVAVVMRIDSLIGNPEVRRSFITSDAFAFMPNGNPLVVIEKIDDPRIEQIVAKIRAARAKADSDSPRT